MTPPPSREIPLREVFLTVGDYLRWILRHWYLPLLLGLAYGAYRAYVAREAHTDYYAQLTFVLNEESNRGGGVGGLLGQFGLGGAATGGTTPEKIIALARSRKLLNDLLLDSISVDGRSDRLANHLIGAYDLVEEWELREDQRAIIHGTIAAMTEREKALLKRMYSFLGREVQPLLRVSSDEDTGILTISAVSRRQDISMAVAYGLYDRLSRFYTEESTGNARATVQRLSAKADSVAGVLTTAEYELARLMDSRLGTLQRSNLVRQAQLQRQVGLLNLTYTEVLRNLETASFALSTRTPFFQTIDLPFTPLYNDEPDWRREGLLGVLLGAVLGGVVLTGIKFYRDVMSGR